MNKAQVEHPNRRQVPRQMDYVQFGPVSQVDIQAKPICAESRDNPAAIARECQLIADEFKLPVVLSVELWQGGWDKFTFKPQKP